MTLNLHIKYHVRAISLYILLLCNCVAIKWKQYENSTRTILGFRPSLTTWTPLFQGQNSSNSNSKPRRLERFTISASYNQPLYLFFSFPKFEESIQHSWQPQSMQKLCTRSKGTEIEASTSPPHATILVESDLIGLSNHSSTGIIRATTLTP